MKQAYVILEETDEEPLSITTIVQGHDYAVRRFKEEARRLFASKGIPAPNYEPTLSELWHHSDCSCRLSRAGFFAKIFMQVYDVEFLPSEQL